MFIVTPNEDLGAALAKHILELIKSQSRPFYETCVAGFFADNGQLIRSISELSAHCLCQPSIT